MGDTPNRTIRIPDALWDKAIKKAESYGTNVTTVIRTTLERYVVTDDDSSTAEILARIMADCSELQRRLNVKVKRH